MIQLTRINFTSQNIKAIMNLYFKTYHITQKHAMLYASFAIEKRNYKIVLMQK